MLTFQPIETKPEKIEKDVFYFSEKYRCAFHICPCGCGEEVVLGIGFIEGEGWRLEKNDDKFSVTPSILNHPCEAHYYITNNEFQIL